MSDHALPDLQTLQALKAGDVPDGFPDELRRSLRPGPMGVPMIHHPLMIDMLPVQTPEFYEQALAARKERVAAADAAREHHRAIFLHERPYRLDAFLERKHAGKLEGEYYWKTLGQLWIDCEYPHVNRDLWHVLWTQPHDGIAPVAAMDAKDTRHFAGLRAQAARRQLVLYRGGNHRNATRGLSWTTDKAKAVWFSTRLCRDTADARVWTVRPEPKHLIAYLSGRGESEVLLDFRALPKHRITLHSPTP